MQVDLDKSLIGAVDTYLTSPLREDVSPIGPAGPSYAPVDRSTWGRTPDALAAQQRSVQQLPGRGVVAQA